MPQMINDNDPRIIAARSFRQSAEARWERRMIGIGLVFFAVIIAVAFCLEARWFKTGLILTTAALALGGIAMAITVRQDSHRTEEFINNLDTMPKA